MTANFHQYDTTVNYLYSLQKHGVKLGLSNISRLMDILGEPHKSFHSVHIAGTNGKGSTSSAIASVLMENGYRVGLFTSPHLVSFTERIRINNQLITESKVIETAAMIHDSIAGAEVNPTFFEFVTAMAFHYFAQNDIDWAVVETGMGGRLDATNIIQPEASVITNISLDHCEFLGNSLSDITFEKAGIIKAGVPVITSSTAPEVYGQLSEIADKRNSKIHIYGKNFKGTLLSMDEKQIHFNYFGSKNYNALAMSLTGKYQLYNACTAVKTCEILRERGFTVSDDSIRKGLLNVRIEGRLERISESPPIIVDGAHNPEAAASLADTVKALFHDKKIILVVGVMDDKDISGILTPLAAIANSIILTKPQYERAAAPEKLTKILKELDSAPPSITATTTVREALELAKTNYREDNIILVTGSFYTIGEVKEILGSKGVLSALREQFKSEKVKD